LYLTQQDAQDAPIIGHELAPRQYGVQFVANQPATGASYTLTFLLWEV